MKIIFKKTTIIFCALLCAAFVFAQVPDAETMYGIMDKAFFNNFLEDFTCTLSLIIEKPNEPKEAVQFKLFRRDVKDQTCLVQIAPEADKGVGYLQEKNNLWAYDPISRRRFLRAGKVFCAKRRGLDFKNRKLRGKRAPYEDHPCSQICKGKRSALSRPLNSHKRVGKGRKNNADFCGFRQFENPRRRLYKGLFGENKLI